MYYAENAMWLTGSNERLVWFTDRR